MVVETQGRSAAEEPGVGSDFGQAALFGAFFVRLRQADPVAADFELD